MGLRRSIISIVLILCFAFGALPAVSLSDTSGKQADRSINTGVTIDTDPTGGYTGDYVIVYNPSTDVSTSVTTGNMTGLIETEINPSVLPYEENGSSRGAKSDAEPYIIDVDQELAAIEPEGEPAKRPETKAGWGVGSTWDYSILDYTTYNINTIKFKVLYVGSHCRIWTTVDSAYHPLDAIDTGYAKTAADEFDSKYVLMNASYGDFNDTNGDGKVNLLFYNIDDGWQPGYEGYVGGFFWQGDFYYNDLPMIHIDTYPGVQITDAYGNVSSDVSRCYTTLVHEFQHLINYSVTGGMAAWLNEAFSGSAEELCYPGRSLFGRIQSWHRSYFESYDQLINPPKEYSYDPNVPLHKGDSLTNWNNSESTILTRYAEVLFFSQFLYSKYGNTSVFRNVIECCSGDSVADSLDALKKGTGWTITAIWRDFFTYMIANCRSAGYGFRMNDGYDPSGLYDIKDVYTLLSPVVYTSGSAASIYGGGFITVKPVGGVYNPPSGASSKLKYVGVKVERGYNPPYGYNEHDYRKLLDYFEAVDPETGVKNGVKAFGTNYDPCKPELWSGVSWAVDANGDYRLSSFAISYCDLSGVLDLADCSYLCTVNVYSNKLEGIVLSGCTSVSELNVAINCLKTLDVSSCTVLSKLACRYNELTYLDLSANSYLPQDLIYSVGSGTIGYEYGYDGCIYLNAFPQDDSASFICWGDENNYRVSEASAIDVSGYSSRTFSAWFTAAVPTLKAGNDAETGKVTLSWTPVINATEYEVWRSTSENGEYSFMLTTAKTSYKNTSAKAGVKYYYFVRALVNSGYYSDYSNVVYRTCDLPRPVVKTENLESSGRVKLSWEAISGAIGYEVYRAVSKNGNYSVIGSTDKLYFTDSDGAVGKTYYYRVVAMAQNSAANSAKSVAKSRTRDLPRPVVSVSHNADTGKNKLTWAAIDGAVSYEVYRASSSTSDYKLMTTVTGTSYTNTSAVAGKAYYYKVKAIASNEKANSAYSLVKSATCDLPRPVVSISHNADTGKNKLTWAAIDGAVSYEVYRASSSTSDYKLMTTVTGTSYTNTSAVAGKAYYYKVIAVASNEKANSAYSAVKSATCDLPRPVVSVALSSGHPKLSWKAIDGAESYKIYYRAGSSGSYSALTTTSKLYYTHSAAKAGTTYYYKVVALHSVSAANSAYSKAVSIKAK